jgi:hypothetical protein
MPATYTPRGDTIDTASRLRAIKEALRELTQIRQLADQLAGAALDYIEANGRRPIVRDRLTSALAVLLSHCPPQPRAAPSRNCVPAVPPLVGLRPRATRRTPWRPATPTGSSSAATPNAKRSPSTFPSSSR